MRRRLRLGGRHPPFSPYPRGGPMRFVYLFILLIVLAAVAVFDVQNNEPVTVCYLDRSISTSLPALIAAVYLLGMVSGWTVVGFLTRSLRRVTERRNH